MLVIVPLKVIRNVLLCSRVLYIFWFSLIIKREKGKWHLIFYCGQIGNSFIAHCITDFSNWWMISMIRYSTTPFVLHQHVWSYFNRLLEVKTRCLTIKTEPGMKPGTLGLEGRDLTTAPTPPLSNLLFLLMLQKQHQCSVLTRNTSCVHRSIMCVLTSDTNHQNTTEFLWILKCLCLCRCQVASSGLDYQQSLLSQSNRLP